jgi:hypothetical protein
MTDRCAAPGGEVLKEAFAVFVRGKTDDSGTSVRYPLSIMNRSVANGVHERVEEEEER